MSTLRRVGGNLPAVLWLALILLLAAALRIYGVYNLSPPGLAHDEVANWLIDRQILDDGRLTPYFSEAYGHEAGFHYLQAAAVGLVGDHALALRLPAIWLGILVVAVHYALARRLFGRRTALLSAALLAVLFWPVFYSRLALRAISLPFVAGLALYAWCRAWPLAAGPLVPPRRATLWFALAGLLGGLTLYTYMAARAVPIFFAVFVLYLALTRRAAWRRNWRGVALFALLFVLTALPLLLYLQGNPGAEFRISEVDAPLRALQAGDATAVLQNGLRIAGMFGLQGDPLWRQNVADRPVFDPLLALLFYAGVALSLWRWRDERHALLLLWLATAVLPSLVTVDAPSSIRMINALLVITIFPVLVLNIFTAFSTERWRLSTDLGYLLGLLLVGYHIWWTAAAVFHSWPVNEEVRFVWQEALTDTAVHLDGSPISGPVAVGGWSPGTMDPPTMNLSMRRRDLPLRFFGSDAQDAPITTLIVPQAPGDTVRITRPAIRELDPALEAQLGEWGAEIVDEGSFVRYSLPGTVAPPLPVENGALLGEEVVFLGAGPPSCSAAGCALLTYWRVLASADGQRRFFLHAVDGAGALAAQDDALDAPAASWQPGDLLVQAHHLPLGELGGVALRLGLYDPQTGVRLAQADGRDFISLPAGRDEN